MNLYGFRYGSMLFCLIRISMIFMPLKAQQIIDNQGFAFKRLTVKDGLSQGLVTSILQDQRGFMWFGTEDGLNKYDGYQFTVFYHNKEDSTGLRTDYVEALHEDPQGRIWVGTSEGLDIYYPEINRFEPLNVPEIGKRSHIHVIQQAHDANKLWIGGTHGLVLYDTENQKVEKQIFHSLVTCFLVAKDGKMWIGTKGEGLFLMDKKGELLRRFQATAEPNSLSQNRVTALLQDKNQTIWIGTEGGGLCKYMPENQTFEVYKGNPNSVYTSLEVIWDIHEKEDKLWLASTTGLHIFDPQMTTMQSIHNQPNHEQSLSGNHLLEIYEDREKNIWIGTFRTHISVLHPTNRFHLISRNRGGQEILDENRVLSFYEASDHKIWFCLDGGGLNIYDPDTKKMQIFKYEPSDNQSVASNAILSAYQDKAGTFWLGTWGGGLQKFDPKTGKTQRFYHDPNDPASLPNNNIWRVLEDSHGNFWVSTHEKGLALFDKNTGKVLQNIIPKSPEIGAIDAIGYIFEDSKREVYFCSWLGFIRYNHQTKTFKVYRPDRTDPYALPGHISYCVYEDSKHQFWVGTSNGLARFDRQTERFERVDLGMKNTHYQAVSIIEDEKGFLWIATKQGIVRYNSQTQETLHFSASDGLQAGEFLANSVLKLKNGDLMFGGTQGANRFTPSHVVLNKKEPPVFITDFQLFNQSITLHTHPNLLSKVIESTQKITLDHTQSVFTLDFVALNYAQPEKNQYQFKLEGFDKDWRDGSRQSATYTNLDAGTYTFRVMASNNHNIWNKKGTSLQIVILPPWWETLIAKISFTIIFLSIFLAIYKFRTWQLKSRQKELQHMVFERTFDLRKSNQNLENEKNKLSLANEELSIQKQEIEAQSEELQQQAEEIKRMNELLNSENLALKDNVKELTKARVLLRDVDFVEFSKLFPDDDSCYKYLAELKWNEKFECFRCGNDKYAEGQGHHARRCSKCRYNESATANTIFHRGHIPIRMAFYMLFLVYANKGEITSQELSDILNIRQKTCWKFRKKVLEKLDLIRKTEDEPDGWDRIILD